MRSRRLRAVHPLALNPAITLPFLCQCLALLYRVRMPHAPSLSIGITYLLTYFADPERPGATIFPQGQQAFANNLKEFSHAEQSWTNTEGFSQHRPTSTDSARSPTPTPRPRPTPETAKRSSLDSSDSETFQVS